MRMWHLGVLGILTVALIGCTPPTSNPSGSGEKGGGADKLKTAMVGKWECKLGDKKVAYEFKNDGKFDFEGDKLKFNGEWKAMDDKHVSLKYNLTEEQIKEAKELK